MKDQRPLGHVLRRNQSRENVTSFGIEGFNFTRRQFLTLVPKAQTNAYHPLLKTYRGSRKGFHSRQRV
jgi:hypothetical protein